VARRNRDSSDTAPAISPARVSRTPTGKAAVSGPFARAATPSGFPISGYSGYSGIGANAEVRKATTSAATWTLAHQRQRGDGNFPVGASSRTKPVRER
jgi:hypothetical protein